jgi:pimeloyl-ACP methyl ester carboxylesterase
MSGQDDLNLRILGVHPGEEVNGARRLTLQTTRGDIELIVHGATPSGRAVLCLSGALGGVDGPSKLYPRLGASVPQQGITVTRLNYRVPNEFGECVLDTVAGLTFLKAMQDDRLAIIGHSFGGAVAINAGTLSPEVKTVIGISSQLFGAHVAGELAPRALLLLHGTADEVLPAECSERIFENSQEPKVLRLFTGVGHRFAEAPDELFECVRDWLAERL